MSARPQKKFRIEIQQEEYLAQLNGNPPLITDNSSVGTQEVLNAIAALREDLLSDDGLSAGLGADTERIVQEKILVENELKMLSKALDDTKKEIAGLRYSSVYGDRISTMNNQLDEVVKASEDATNNILASAEEIDSEVQKLQINVVDDDQFVALENVSAEVIKIYESCNFQDLTGQRVTKVIETLKHVEARVDAMIKCLGGDEIAFAELIEQEETKEIEDVTLEGPQSAGEGISQDDIDSMFD